MVERKLAYERRVTFRAFAQRWIEETLFYRSAGYRAQIVRWLDANVNPAIGDMAMGDVQFHKSRQSEPGSVGAQRVASRVR